MKALLLDAGGTIVFPNFQKIAEELEREGIRVDPQAMAKAEVQMRFEYDQEGVIRATNDATRWLRLMQRLFHFAGAAHISPSALWRLKRYHDKHNIWDFVPPDVPGSLDALAQRFRLGVVSNSNGTVRALLQRVGLADRFETIVDSHEEGVEKPDPRIFTVALERMGLTASETAYVGDLYHVDVVGAKAAGLTPFLLDPLGLYSDKPCTRVKSLREIAL